ncbi:unnamed protein product [Musa banksii]
MRMAANSIVFSLHLLTTLASVAGNLNDGNSPSESFLHCFLNRTGSSETSTLLIYTPNTTSYDTILRSSIQNTRFHSAAATKPAFIVRPAVPADVQAAVACGRAHGLRIRVRSSGHDYEGLSYVSAGGPFAILDLSNLRSVAVDADGRTAWVGAGATVGEGATKLVERWQHVAPKLVDDLLIRAIAVADDATALGKRTIRVTFPGMFLGRQRELLSVMNESFSELGAEAKHCSEVSWMESAAYFAGYSDMNWTMLLERRRQYNSSSFKAKSDFVRKPISEKGWKGIWRFMAEDKHEPVVMIMEPWGGRMDEIAETAIAFPHRKGNLFNIQNFIRWMEGEEAASESHLEWMRRFHQYMSPHVSRNPRAAYLN